MRLVDLIGPDEVRGVVVVLAAGSPFPLVGLPIVLHGEFHPVPRTSCVPRRRAVAGSSASA